MIINPWQKFQFAFCCNAEGEDGGGAGGGEAVGSAAGEGGAASAGAESTAAPASFLTQGRTEGDAKPEETKVEGDAASEDPTAGAETKAEGDEAKAEEAPVVFDATKLTLTEGVELSEEAVKVFTDLLNNSKLTPQERGQQLVDLHVKALEDHAKSVTEAVAKANMETWTKMNDEWRAQIAKLPEFKNNPDGEAGKIFQTLTTLGAGKDFFAAVDLTGAGNHPAILQMLHKLVQPFVEGKAVGGEAKPTVRKQPGANMYTSTTKG